MAELEDHAKAELQYSIDYFDHFMQGKVFPGYQAREPTFSNFPTPFWNPPRQDPAFAQPAPLWDDERRRPFRIYRRTDSGANRTVDPHIEEALRVALGLNLIRIVGAGSQGLAALFQYQDQKIVLKWSSDLEAMVIEMWAMRQLVGARHIVQRRFLPGLSDNGVSARITDAMINEVLSGEFDYNAQLAYVLDIDMDDLPSCPMIYAMEWVRHGNFNGLLRKISETEALLKDSQLWRIFHCLFRACIALAHPGRWDRGEDPQLAAVDTQEELVPLDATGTRPLPTDRGLVDFDMNDRNVMLGDYDPPAGADADAGAHGHAPAHLHAHDGVPVFKVGDFGHIRAFRTPRFRWSFHALVRGRVCGNRWCNTPEQFAQSWKNHGGIESLLADETAGKYDWWTNLWEIAQLMNITITQFAPDIPPDCVRVGITKPNGVVEQVFTYGSHLLSDEYDYYDYSLRNTVAWCMAHRPQDRPTLLELDAILRAATARQYETDNEEDRVTVAELLNSPPPPNTAGPTT